MVDAETEHLLTALRGLAAKPDDSATRSAKQSYSQKMSTGIANSIAESLRGRGLTGTRPSLPGIAGISGAERRMAGGIGDKRVDVTWATEQSGLLLGLSIKTINFRDRRSNNFQKNFTNRRGDMLFEAVTLHRRFPYAVLGGIMFLDKGASEDGTGGRRSTFVNAHAGLRLFTGRDDPAGREEQFERFYVALVEATPFRSSVEFYAAGVADESIPFPTILDQLVLLVSERNSDMYEFAGGRLRRANMPVSDDIPLSD